MKIGGGRSKHIPATSQLHFFTKVQVLHLPVSKDWRVFLETLTSIKLNVAEVGVMSQLKKQQ